MSGERYRLTWVSTSQKVFLFLFFLFFHIDIKWVFSALTMSISQTCFHYDDVIGIMGVDLHMEDIVQDVTYYDEMDGSYAFIINSEGILFYISVILYR